MTSAGLDWAREKWKFGVGSKFIRQGEKNAVKYADEIIVLSKGVQKYFMETYGRETHFIPNGVNRPEVREKYTSIRRKDYLEWRIRLEHEMTKAEKNERGRTV